MIKTPSELSDHIEKLIKSGELSFQTYSNWLSRGDFQTLYQCLAIENYEQKLRESIDKKYYINYLREQLVDLTRLLYTCSSHSRNEWDLMEVKALAEFLKKDHEER